MRTLDEQLFEELLDARTLLTEILRKNKHGYWFFHYAGHSGYIPLPRWYWPLCNKAVPNPMMVEDDGASPH